MEIVTAWFNTVFGGNDPESRFEVSSDDVSRTWKAFRKDLPEFSMQIWFDFSEIFLRCGNEHELFEFNSELRGIPQENSSTMKKLRISSSSFFLTLASCLSNLEDFRKTSFKRYAKTISRKNFDDFSFLSKSLLMIETGIDVIVVKNLKSVGVVPDGALLMIAEGGSFVFEGFTVSFGVERTPQTLFLFLHWVLNGRESLSEFWDKKTTRAELWENPSPTPLPYSARYRSRFEIAVGGLAKLENPSFEIPELRPRGFTLEVEIREMTHVIMCFALAEFRIKAIIKDDRRFLFIW